MTSAHKLRFDGRDGRAASALETTGGRRPGKEGFRENYKERVAVAVALHVSSRDATSGISSRGQEMGKSMELGEDSGCSAWL